jgi:hypothetical protein
MSNLFEREKEKYGMNRYLKKIFMLKRRSNVLDDLQPKFRKKNIPVKIKKR